MINIDHSKLLKDIFHHAEITPGKIALIESDSEISYIELKRNIIGKAAALQSAGLHKGDKIVLSAQKDKRFIYVYFAAHLLGVINVVVDSKSNEDRLKYIVEITKPAFIIGFQNPAINHICRSYDEFQFPQSDSIQTQALLQSVDVADIMFTTGTTGNPKGVLLTHDNINSSAENINSVIRNTEDDIEIIGLPISHSFGLGRIRCVLKRGGTLILIGSFANVKLFFDTIEKYKATGFGMVPAAWQYIKTLSGDRIGRFSSQIKYIEIGSAPMSVAEKTHLAHLFPDTHIYMHYGLTEASRSFFMEFHQYADHLTSIGIPTTQNISVKIFDESGNEVPQGSEGEICIKGNMVMKSYFLPEENMDTFWGKYFRSGDWGYQDENGLYYLISRKKELINIGGKKVSPAEIEDVVLATGVVDCACVAIKDPSGILGEVPKVFLQKSKNAPTITEIREYIAQHLEKYKMPYEFEWINRIPRSSSGKLQRLSLKQ